MSRNDEGALPYSHIMYPFAAEQLAEWLVRAYVEWRAGPETDESRAISDQIDDLQVEIARMNAQIETLKERRLRVRRAARDARPSWWTANQQALVVNIVAGLIVGIPILVIGVLIGRFWA